MKRKALLVTAGLAVVGSLGAADGVAFQDKKSWNARTTWFGAIPANGGRAVVSNTVSEITQDLAGLSLSRLEIPGSTGVFTLKGAEPVAFVGDAAIDMPNDADASKRDTSHMCVVDAPVKVESGNSLTLTGGWWHQLASLTGSGPVYVADGALRMTNTVAILHAGSIDLCGGGFHYVPKLAAGASAATQISGALRASRLGSTVKLTRGSGASATLTVGKLELPAAGSLMVAGSAGFPGETEKLLIAQEFPVPHGDLV